MTDKRELAAAMYETLLELGLKRDLGFDRIAPTFKLLAEPEHSKWIEWADTVLRRIEPSNVEQLRPR